MTPDDISNLTSKLDTLANLLLQQIPQQKPLIRGLLADVIAEFLAAKKLAGLRPKYLSVLKCTLGQFRKGFGSETDVMTITDAQIEAWLHGHKWSNRTKYNYVTDLRTFFEFAKLRNYVRVNPAKAVVRPVPEAEECGVLTIPELKHVLMTAKEIGLGQFVGVMLFAGVRPAEAERLTKASFRPKAIIVQAKGAKTRKRRPVPILPALARWIDYCGGWGEWPPVNRHNLIKELHASIPRWPHDALRNCFVSYSLPVYGARKVSLWAGHDEKTMFNKYAEIITEDEADEFWSLCDQLPRRRNVLSSGAPQLPADSSGSRSFLGNWRIMYLDQMPPCKIVRQIEAPQTMAA